MTKKLGEYALYGLIAVGFLLRLAGITAKSYWEDELLLIDFSDPARSFSDMYARATFEPHPPLYQIQQWLWFKAFGYTEVTGRLLGVLCGMGGVIATYYLAKHFFGKRAGLYAAALASLNYFYIQTSIDVRSYAQFYLLAAATILFFARMLEKPSLRSGALFAFSTTCLIYTHFVGLFFLPVLFAYFFAYLPKSENRERSIRVAVTSAICVVILYLPIYSHVFRHATSHVSISPQPRWGFFPDVYLGFFDDPILATLFALLLLCAMAAIFLRPQVRYPLSLLLSLSILPCALTFARGLIGDPILKEHHTIVMLPGLFAAAAYALEEISRKFRLGICLAFGFIAFSGYSVMFLSNHFQYYSREDYRLAAQTVMVDEIPVFAPRRTGKRLNTYLTLLGGQPRVRQLAEMEELAKNKALPEKIWVLNVHYPAEWPEQNWKVLREISGNTMNGRLYQLR